MPKLTEEQRRRRALARARREALEAEKDHRRHEERRELWQRERMYLSREEAAAGQPCRACGEPVIDGLGSWPALLHMTEQERREYDAADERFRATHSDCRAVRWSIHGSRATHCGLCCPPLPLGPRQAEAIAKILFSDRNDEQKKQLDTWKLTLTCNHSVERTQHRDHQYYSMRVVPCSECDMDRGVVEGEHLGPAADLDISRDPRSLGPIARERLIAELNAAEKKFTRQQKSAAVTQGRIDEIRATLRVDATVVPRGE